MGILANSVSVCHFQVVGDFPEGDLFEWIGTCLDKQAFRSIEEGAEEKLSAWLPRLQLETRPANQPLSLRYHQSRL